MATAAATFLLRENPGLRLLIIEKSTRFARRVGEATVEVSAFFIGIRLTNCTLKLKKDTRLQIVNPIPAKLGLVRRPDAALKAPALGRLRALFRVHLKIIRLSGPPALK